LKNYVENSIKKKNYRLNNTAIYNAPLTKIIGRPNIKIACVQKVQTNSEKILIVYTTVTMFNARS